MENYYGNLIPSEDWVSDQVKLTNILFIPQVQILHQIFLYYLIYMYIVIVASCTVSNLSLKWKKRAKTLLEIIGI